MHDFLSRFCGDESAATAIEYGLIAGGIAATIIATVNALGATVLSSLFQVVVDSMGP